MVLVNWLRFHRLVRYVGAQKCDLEACSSTNFTIDVNGSMVKHDQTLRDREAKTVSAVARGPGRIHPVEPLEDAFMLGLGNADTVVAHNESALFC